MRNRSALAVASVLTSMLAFSAPAGAAPNDDWGYTCAMTATSRDGVTWQGVMLGGPWAVPDNDPVSMRCILQEWTGETWRTIAIAESQPTPGVTVVPPKLVNFVAPIGTHASLSDPTNLQMCTQITVYRDPMQPPDVYPVDADENPNNGAQCEKEERTESELVYVTVFPPRPYGRPCIWWDDSDLPDQVPGETCVI